MGLTDGLPFKKALSDLVTLVFPVSDIRPKLTREDKLQYSEVFG